LGERHSTAGSVLKTVYLGLGSNVGDREGNIRTALEKLNAAGVKVTRLSPLYETEPQGLAEQSWFLNAVAEVQTELFPLQLLARIQAIERELKRRRTVANGPRTLDIDILLYGDAVIDCKELAVPHPRYRERRFVLAPLADLAPKLRDPVTRKTVTEMLAELKGQKVSLFLGRPDVSDPQ
jgi:2-amino-4-hydroxy-6-hydroxymethyldihydropteridine diphosphokinase